MELAGIELRDEPYDYERALSMVPADHRGAMIAMSSPIFFNDRKRLTEVTLRRRLPAMFPQREFVDLGAMLSYGPNVVALLERAADYVGSPRAPSRQTSPSSSRPSSSLFSI